MALTLYDAFVPTCQQILGALNGVLDKGQAYAAEHGISDDEMLGARLAEDMWNLPWHPRSCWMHSAYAIAQVKTGEFTPNFETIPDSWDGMRAQVQTALDDLEKVSADELEAIADNSVHFVLGGKRLMEFTVQDFLLSFSIPNVMFHATTAYDILRMKGVPLSKRDFMGAPRTK
ncbi:DUF1993 family protein [Altererythrobacter sp. MF3-039]|uniref:DUF1993 domain-containing protein n=1 Tax=Altererythrobacter sp. MF3-039 TaxID=3252901 RepID=UPI00390CB6C3